MVIIGYFHSIRTFFIAPLNLKLGKVKFFSRSKHCISFGNNRVMNLSQ